MMEYNNKFLTNGQIEPTNEEIAAQTGIAIARGADGISWFFYPSFKTGGTNTYLLENPPPPPDTFLMYLE